MEDRSDVLLRNYFVCLGWPGRVGSNMIMRLISIDTRKTSLQSPCRMRGVTKAAWQRWATFLDIRTSLSASLSVRSRR